MTINDWLGRRELLTPDKTALVDTQRDGLEITYRLWNQSANRTANFLRQRLGVGPGMRVAVLSKNCVEYLDVWFALGKLGAVLQNLNWRLSARELVKLVQTIYEPKSGWTLDSGRECIEVLLLAARYAYPTSENINELIERIEVRTSDPPITAVGRNLAEQIEEIKKELEDVQD